MAKNQKPEKIPNPSSPPTSHPRQLEAPFLIRCDREVRGRWSSLPLLSSTHSCFLPTTQGTTIDESGHQKKGKGFTLTALLTWQSSLGYFRKRFSS
ncbi:hypothetical protein FH972_010486 [Carpinus fangiana]|uniref:Uncharacterized protein n=1 Tax=Carpinus fangiana TaxID=176857 RepID=A0A660KVF8_9ROSI|nr:hypothetical protein FH972_010486 [Carpinus fangiana]